jgi:hypothetical protein
MLIMLLFCAPVYAFGVPASAPSCCMREKRLATPQCSVILPSRTRITSTVSNWILRPVGAMNGQARKPGRGRVEDPSHQLVPSIKERIVDRFPIFVRGTDRAVELH